MKHTFIKLREHKPHKTNRSPRLEKKLHVGKFAETYIAADMVLGISGIDDFIDTEMYFDIMDALYEADMDFATFGFYENKPEEGVVFEYWYDIPTTKFSEQYVREVSEKIQTVLQSLLPEVQVSSVKVAYGDAYYGAW